MKKPDYVPADYDRLAIAGDADELFGLELKGRINCILLPRSISGDFNGLARDLIMISALPYEQRNGKRIEIYNRLSLIAEGSDEIAKAARQVKADIDMLKEKPHYLSCDLRIIGTEYYTNFSVHGLHMDVGQAMDDMGTVMCPYTKPTTGWARNEDCAGGLRPYAMTGDLARVFTLNRGAKKYDFQPGDMIRQAAERNFHNVPGFIHIAERIRPGELRLLLVGRGPDTEPMSP